MGKQQPIEIFMPPNMLKAKVGGSAGGLDMSAIKRAEKAIETLRVEFTDWINADVERLAAAREAFAKAPDAERQDDLFRAGHDLKGQALTFGFPMAARVAASLCKLLDGNGRAPLPLIDAHVDAIRVIVRNNVKDESDRVANILASELEGRVAESLKANAA
ncbi:MAG TPA: Hpt domain-containing protein [Rhizomicrobium sp.]|nr:Hpt domain-containing protein [Rhizomicrobium sp.]